MTFQAIDMHCSFCSRSDQNAGPLRGSTDGATGTSNWICRECALIAIDSIERTRNEQIANSLVGLSSREVDVFTSIGRGLTSRQIASHLEIAVSTVETYRERLKDKLKLHSGNELVRSATIWFATGSFSQ
jgi:DNA-binding NarL/FixJ family response regulator